MADKQEESVDASSSFFKLVVVGLKKTTVL